MGPVSHIGMYIERSVVSSWVFNSGGTVTPGKLCGPGPVQDESIFVDVLPACAALAQRVDCPVGAVLFGAFEEKVLSTVIALGQAVGAG